MKNERRSWFVAASIAFAILLLTGFIYFTFYFTFFQKGDDTFGGLSASLKSIAALPDSGISLEDFRNTMGLAARHELTVQEPDGIYTLVTCFFRGDFNNFWYIFRDGSLIKTVTSFAHVKSRENWAIDDADNVRSIDAIINAPAATRREVLNGLSPPREYPSDNALPIFFVIPLELLAAGHIGPDYQAAKRLMERYSGFKVKLGMNEGDVGRLYGKPTGSFHLRQGEIVYIYYDDREDQSYVVSALAFHGTAVVMSPSGIVTECLSDGFFSPNWKK